MQIGLIVHTLLTNDKGEVLILRRSKENDTLPEYWDIPGGTLEDGEGPEQGAMREVKEETGLSISSLKLFFQRSNIDASKNKQFVTLVFYAESSNTDITVNPTEHDEFAWINLSDVVSYKTVDYLPDCFKAYATLSKLAH